MTRATRFHTRGVTVFELIVGTAGLAVLALVALLLVRPHVVSAEKDEATKDASRILTAAQHWREQNGAEGCPTISQLMQEKQLDESARTDDPWGERYRVRCSGDELSVVSPGRDKTPNTSDDIRVPSALSQKS